jgi:formylglycine-generating enzyme required for sulfatase activity
LSDPLQLVGTTIGDKYAVESVVGEGGFAIVYRATHLIWKRPVAIKAFKAMGSFAEADRERLFEEFVREGKLLAELSERSAAICQARDIGTTTTPSGMWAPYMVLEWLDGVTLEAVLSTERAAGTPMRTAGQAVHLLEPVAEALSLAHGRGIAHRDVKPGNVMIIGDARSTGCTVKLLDFGIAKVVQDAQKMAGAFSQTSGQITSFTPAYGAPEQFSRTHGATGPWTDVFALALIFTELVTGKDPLQGDDIGQLGFASMNPTSRPTPRTLGADVSDEVEAVIAKAVSVPTQDRYATASEMWNALRTALAMAPMRLSNLPGADGGVPSRPPVSSQPPLSHQSTVLAAAAASNADTARTMGGAAASTPPPKRTTAIGVGVAIVVAVGGALAFVASRGGESGVAKGAVSGEASLPPSASVAAAAPKCPEGMVSIPGGKFFMGSDDKDDLEFERPAHQVTLSPYCVDKFEVTVERYKACSDKGECKRAPTSNDWDGITSTEKKSFDPLCNGRDAVDKLKHPINCVDWDMADAFCKAAVPHGRLPTEAEWEFAARGPDGRKFPWGDEWPDAKHLNACDKECVAWGKANHVDESAMYKEDDGFANTAPVGSFPLGASRYGVEDVVGNVWEWTADWYAPYTAAGSVDPKGPEHETDDKGRVIRGGAWNGAYPAWVRPTFRYHDSPSKRSYGVGFRCAAALE